MNYILIIGCFSVLIFVASDEVNCMSGVVSRNLKAIQFFLCLLLGYVLEGGLLGVFVCLLIPVYVLAKMIEVITQR